MMSEIIPLLKKAEQNTCWANSRKEIKTFGTSAVSFRHFLRTLVDSKEIFFCGNIFTQENWSPSATLGKRNRPLNKPLHQIESIASKLEQFF